MDKYIRKGVHIPKLKFWGVTNIVSRKLSWKSSSPEVLMPHRSNASEDPMVPRQLSEGSTATIQAQCDRKFRRPPSEVLMPT